MSKHGAEENLPVSELAQWMRDTTGRPDDGSGSDFYRAYRRDRPILTVVNDEGEPFWPTPQRAQPGTLTVDDVIQVAEIDPKRLHRAALDAIASYRAEGHTDDEVAVHTERIWALHDQVLEASR